MPKPAAFTDLPAEKFPFSITALGPDGSIFFAIMVREGPAVVDIPGGGPGSVTRVIMVYGDGTHADYEPGS